MRARRSPAAAAERPGGSPRRARAERAGPAAAAGLRCARCGAPHPRVSPRQLRPAAENHTPAVSGPGAARRPGWSGSGPPSGGEGRACGRAGPAARPGLLWAAAPGRAGQRRSRRRARRAELRGPALRRGSATAPFRTDAASAAFVGEGNGKQRTSRAGRARRVSSPPPASLLLLCSAFLCSALPSCARFSSAVGMLSVEFAVCCAAGEEVMLRAPAPSAVAQMDFPGGARGDTWCCVSGSDGCCRTVLMGFPVLPQVWPHSCRCFPLRQYPRVPSAVPRN